MEEAWGASLPSPARGLPRTRYRCTALRKLSSSDMAHRCCFAVVDGFALGAASIVVVALTSAPSLMTNSHWMKRASVGQVRPDGPNNCPLPNEADESYRDRSLCRRSYACH